MFRKTKTSWLLTPVISLATMTQVGISPAVMAEEAAEIEQVIVTGSRGRPRTVSDSPVPIDVFSAQDIEAISFTDTNDILQTLVPSYNVSRSNFSGGSYIRPATLRGLQSDKTLVLVNSKRRHRSPYVDFNDQGAHAADVATIPGVAIKNIEVLRDGAGAQYGSDAIAGIINFILKDNREGGAFTVDVGQYDAGDGDSFNVQGNIGLPLTENGFISISGEYTQADSTSRGEEYCEAFFCADPNGEQYQAFLDRVATRSSYAFRGAVAQDPTFLTAFNNHEPNSGDGDVVQPWGQPELEGALRLFYNAGIDLDNGSELYSFGNYSYSEANNGNFYRYPGHRDVRETRQADGSIWSPLDIFPGAFSPRTFGEVEDISLLVGLRGEWDNGLAYDFSARGAEGEIEFQGKNTINPSLGAATPTSFSTGNNVNTEYQLQADFTYEFESGPLLAFGASWLDEEHEVGTGDAASSAVGPHVLADPFGFCNDDGTSTAAGAGVIANGSTLDCSNSSDPVFTQVAAGTSAGGGTTAEFAGTFDRQSTSVYADLSHYVTDNLFLQGAVRLEDYDDFGTETVWKLAGKLDVTDNFGIRASAGTSLRAPTTGQIGTSNISSRIANGVPTERGLFPTVSLAAQSLGALPLEPEFSDSYTIGFTAEVANIDLTLDFYKIDIEDRTFIISPLSVSTNPTAGASYDRFLALQGAGVANASFIGQASFYANGFDSITEGFDLVASTPIDWGDNGVTTLTASVNYTKNEFDSPVSQVSDFLNAEDRFDYENLVPELRGVITARHDVDKLSLVTRLIYFGDSENTTNGTNRQELNDIWYTDLEAQYRLNDSIRLSAGARNLFDVFPETDKLNDYCCGNLYGFQTNLDYQGRYFYARVSYDF